MSALPDLPALSIRQPWASLIALGHKPIENRSWRTKFRGRFLIHAAKGCTPAEWHEALLFAEKADRNAYVDIVFRYGLDDIPRGGIIGVAEIVDCVAKHESPWFCGPYGFVISNAEPVDLVPCRGVLGFFRVGGVA